MVAMTREAEARRETIKKARKGLILEKIMRKALFLYQSSGLQKTYFSHWAVQADVRLSI